ncbi:hypothetical protein BH23PLA1_BH23PLA1_22380 [soil metagenome]
MQDHRTEERPDQPMSPNEAYDDRRREPRHEAIEDRSWLGWWVGLEFVAIAARLLDISQRGAALSTPEPPPVGKPVWLCLQGPRWSGSAEGVVLGQSPIDPEGGHYRVRLEFEEPCPEELFDMALGMIAV